ALHALWVLHGLGLLDGADQESLSVVIEALKHPAPGVRRAAIQTLPIDKPEVVQQLLASGVTHDTDLRIRLAAFLALSDAPPSPEVGKAIFEAAQQPENTADKWISHALSIASAVHQQALMDGKPAPEGVATADGSLSGRVPADSHNTMTIKAVIG